MAQKNNIRSIRFSDELAELIDRQVGRTFTEKFENLVTRCVWELPQKEAELARLDKEIDKRKQELKELWQSAREWRGTLQNINARLMGLEATLGNEIELHGCNTD